MQRSLLEDEGVQFDENGQIDFNRFGWSGPEEAY
jgi:alkylated DNA nucleotide flippase Atl1